MPLTCMFLLPSPTANLLVSLNLTMGEGQGVRDNEKAKKHPRALRARALTRLRHPLPEGEGKNTRVQSTLHPSRHILAFLANNDTTRTVTVNTFFGKNPSQATKTSRYPTLSLPPPRISHFHIDFHHNYSGWAERTIFITVWTTSCRSESALTGEGSKVACAMQSVSLSMRLIAVSPVR